MRIKSVGRQSFESKRSQFRFEVQHRNASRLTVLDDLHVSFMKWVLRSQVVQERKHDDAKICPMRFAKLLHVVELPTHPLPRFAGVILLHEREIAFDLRQRRLSSSKVNPVEKVRVAKQKKLRPTTTAPRIPSRVENGASQMSSDAVASSLMRMCVPASFNQRSTAVCRSSVRRSRSSA